MITCDCLVAGGGPAGSSCARVLVQSGLDVLVLDKAIFPRDKVCAGWITPTVVRELEIDLADYGCERTIQPITGFRTGLIDGPQVCTQYSHVVSYGIRRSEFDHYLLQRSGARLQLGQPLKNLRREQDQWIVNDEIRTPLVVGAGGHFCPVARIVANHSMDRSTVMAQEIEFELSADEAARCLVEPDIPELYFCDDLRGYGWCFRKGKFLNIGLGCEEESQLAAHVAAFCESLQRMGRVPLDTHGRFHGHAYRLYGGQPRQATVDGVVLIGDSAGLAYPQSGEGIRPAIESGLLAAGAIIEAEGDFRQTVLHDIERRLIGRFGRSNSPPAHRSLFPNAWRQALARRLLASRWFTRHILIDRWFLHSNQPALTPAMGKSRP